MQCNDIPKEFLNDWFMRRDMTQIPDEQKILSFLSQGHAVVSEVEYEYHRLNKDNRFIYWPVGQRSRWQAQAIIMDQPFF